MNVKQAGFLLSLSFILIASTSKKEGETPALSSGINQFALTLTTQVDKGENVMISPLSIVMNLGLLANGSKNETQAQILNLFGCRKEQIKDFNSYLATYNHYQNRDPANVLDVGNAIWAAPSEKLHEDFVIFSKRDFNATVDQLNFANSIEAAKIIDAWAQQKTHDKIKRVFGPDELSGVTLVLANAIYYKGSWERPFEPKRTVKGDFYSESGKIQVSYLQDERSVRMSEDEDYKMLELPFKGNRFSFMILMGDKDWLITDYISTLTNERINSLVDKLSVESWALSIPKFRMEFESNLNEHLKALGMNDAFGGNADFTGMVERRGISVEMIKHKTFIEVNEEGAEAAAVTATSMIRSMPKPFKVDRPFLFFIRDNTTGLFLFSGVMRNPKY